MTTWNRNDPAPVRTPGHEPGCDGHCNYACSAAMSLAWASKGRNIRCCWKCNARVPEAEGRKRGFMFFCVPCAGAA